MIAYEQVQVTEKGGELILHHLILSAATSFISKPDFSRDLENLASIPLP
jgi:hypothetical protein